MSTDYEKTKFEAEILLDDITASSKADDDVHVGDLALRTPEDEAESNEAQAGSEHEESMDSDTGSEHMEDENEADSEAPYKKESSSPQGQSVIEAEEITDAMEESTLYSRLKVNTFEDMNLKE